MRPDGLGGSGIDALSLPKVSNSLNLGWKMWGPQSWGSTL